MAKLEISLFGQFKVLLNSAPVTAFESVKVRALLAYLAAEADRPQSREALAGLLWPDWPQQSAIRNLRNTLVHLRQNIGDRDAYAPFLLVTRESIQLNRAADAWVDVSEFEAAISDQGIRDKGKGLRSSGQVSATSDLQSEIEASGVLASNLQSTISLYRGPFLDGFPTTDSAPFEEWVLAKREYFSQQMLKALSRLAEWEIDQGEYEQAEGYARRQIELEPWREQAYQQLMRALSLKGERVQALAQFESLRKALQHELKVEPSEDTLTLYQQIRDGELQGIREQPTPIREQEEQNGDQRSAPGDQQFTINNLKSTIYNPPPRHNLPLQLTSFIGREKEIEAVQGLLQTNRLVTLTGPGGTGKTRLALQTAAGLVDQFADGAWLVELAPLSDPALVPALAARALGLRELTGPQVVELLQDYLEKQQVLLILDNCEHVIEACIRLANTLLQSCHRLSILTSSREALGIAGEASFRVPPLTLPEAAQILPGEDLAQYEAIRLFVERAATVSPGFTLTPANAPAILQICQRLDGIPLAIELAAARVRLLQVEEIAQRLDDRFRLLTGGSRAALPRYQTLRASIDWSYQLLSEAERILLQRLSVFAGGWVLEAAEAVGCGEGIQSCDVLELLGLLVDKSLVQVSSEAAGLSRYRMLETIRQYAHEKLAEAGQAQAVRQLHLQYYLELAEKVEWKIRGPDQAAILERLEAELDNLRLALGWSLEGKGQLGWNPEPGLRLASALWWFWYCCGRCDEGIQWLELLLAGEVEERTVRSERGDRPLTPERTQRRAKALLVTSWIAGQIGEGLKAGKLSAESRALYQSLGTDGRIGYAYTCMRVNTIGNPTDEVRIREQALAILREAGDRFGVSEILGSLGQIALSCNEYERAKDYWEESLALRKEIGDLEGLAGALLGQSILADYRGELKQARALVEECMGMFSAVHNTSYLGIMYLNLANYDMVDGNYVQAAAQAREALSIGRRQGDVNLVHSGLHYLGRLALLQQNYPEVVEWFEQDLAYCRIKDYKTNIAEALFYLGLLAWDQGECDQASKLYTEALINAQESGNKLYEGFTLYHLGKVSFAQGETDQALANFKQALGNFKQASGARFNFRNLELTMLALEGTAYLAAAQGKNGDAARNWNAAARLLGATETWHHRFIHTRLPRERQERESYVAILRAAMGEKAFAAAFAEGQAMTQEQAVEAAQAFCRREAGNTPP